MKNIKFIKNIILKIKDKTNHPLFKNSFFNAGGYIFITFVGLFITPLLVKNFGVEQYGVYVLVTGIFGYYGIFDFGLGQGLIKFVAEYNAKGNLSKLNDAVNSVFWFQCIVGLLISLIIYILSSEIVSILNVSDIYYSDSIRALKIATIGFFFSMLAGTFSASLKGIERYDITSLIDVFSNFILNIILLFVVLYGFGIEIAVLVNVVISVLQLVSLYVLFKKVNPNYSLDLQFELEIVRSFFSFSGYLFLSKITNVLRQQGTRLIISLLLNPSAVTFYVVPLKIINAIGGILSSAAGTLFPYISRLNAKNNISLIKSTFLKVSAMFAAFNIPVLIFVSLFSKPIMTIWMGAEIAEKSWLILSLLAVGSIFGSMTTIPIHTILGLGKSRLILIFSMINVFLYFSVLPIFTYLFNVKGTAFAMMLITFINIFYVLYKTIKSIGLIFNIYIKKVFKYHFVPIFLYLGFSIPIMLKYTNIFAIIIGIGMLIIYYYYIIKKIVLYYRIL